LLRDLISLKEGEDMTRARKELIDLNTTPYYHCISRCVRRAFLCGVDHLTGNNYEHRKDWVVERLAELSKVFAIEVCAYAVMSNHCHLVLRVDQHKAQSWSEEQVMAQWEKLFSVPVLVQQYKEGTDSAAVAIEAKKIIAAWRTRLMDISWYMRSVNEHLARRANEEDRCTGRFWEGRYKSQALLDEAAVLTCMSYVDLNPIRAGMCDTPEESDFTSIQQRIRQWQQSQPPNKKNKSKSTSEKNHNAVPLMRLVKQSQDPHRNAIGYTTKDYLELVDWAGRAIRDNKRGAIPNSIPPILVRLTLNPETYLAFVGKSSPHQPDKIRQQHNKALGSVELLQTLATQLGQKFICGLSDARRLYAVDS
jgi:REP element-mobilizing transposase RayT